MRSLGEMQRTSKAEVSQAIYNAHRVKCAICGTKAVKVLRAGIIHMHQHICSECLEDIIEFTGSPESPDTLKTA